MDLCRVPAGLLPIFNALLSCKLIDDISSFSFRQLYSYIVLPVAACGLILYLLESLMATHQYEDTYSQSRNDATVSMDPADAAIQSGPTRHQNDAAVDEVEIPPLDEAPPEVDETIYPLLVVLQTELITHGNDEDQGINNDAIDNDPDAAVDDDHATPPLQEAPPQLHRTSSPGTRTDILEKELIIHPNDEEQGCNSVTVDKDTDPNARGLQGGLRRRQHEATRNNALEESPPEFGRPRSLVTAAYRTAMRAHPNEVDQGSNGDAIDDDPDGPGLQRGHRDDAADNNALPALDELKIYLQYAFQCGVCKLVSDSRSEMNPTSHQKTSGQHYCDRKFTSCGALLQHLKDSDFCVGKTSRHYWPCKLVCISDPGLIAPFMHARTRGGGRRRCLMLMLGVAVPVLFLVLVLGILARFPILTWYVFLFLC